MTDDIVPTGLRVERIGPSHYVARNDRGAELHAGALGAEGVFAPGELLQLALAACTILASDHTLASRLGDDFHARVDVTANKTDDGYRYEKIHVDLITDMSALDPDTRTALIERASNVIDRRCTIGHTLAHGAEHHINITDAPVTL